MALADAFLSDNWALHYLLTSTERLKRAIVKSGVSLGSRRVCATGLHCTGLHTGQIKFDAQYSQWCEHAELGGPNHASDVKVERMKVPRAWSGGPALRGRHGNRTDRPVGRKQKGCCILRQKDSSR